MQAKDFIEISELGKGRSSKVYEVEHKSSKEKLAIKELTNHSLDNVKERFRNEVKIMEENSGIDGIMPIKCKGNFDNNEFWYAMPITKPILEKIKDSNDGIEEITQYIIQISNTLIELHNREISHRDIKPENIYFYEDKCIIGDFGIVDFQENNLTVTEKPLGSIFTIAPEMKRNPINADGKKADVFSLAKTFWILLTQEEKGFDGVYNYLDETIGLSYKEKFLTKTESREHIVELEELLHDATNNVPDLRPTMSEFKERIVKWQEIRKSNYKINISQWNFIVKQLFHNNTPNKTFWKKIEDIIKILNIISRFDSLNHMLFSDDGGGLDLCKVLLANEENCILLKTSPNGNIILKPKCLYFEYFDEDVSWSYFRLELDVLKPIFGSISDYERLVEDHPGNYVSAKDAEYGVYDYDSGEKLPDGFRVVNRYNRGVFLIILKSSIYNKIPDTYDGRHGLYDVETFSNYMNNLKSMFNFLLSKGVKEQSIVHLIGKDPFEKTKSTKKEDIKKESPTDFIANNYESWNFKDLLLDDEIQNPNAEYSIVFKNDIAFDPLSDSGIEDLYYRKENVICKDGFIRKKSLKEKDPDIFYFSNKKSILLAIEKCNEIIEIEVTKNNYDSDTLAYFSANLHKISNPNPKHLFTKPEIEKLMRNADDRVNNRLVINENGEAEIIQNMNEAVLYPVRMETWQAGNVYVGKYSSLSDLNDTYLISLECWLDYLKTGESQYADVVNGDMNETTLIGEINKLCKKSIIEILKTCIAKKFKSISKYIQRNILCIKVSSK